MERALFKLQLFDSDTPRAISVLEATVMAEDKEPRPERTNTDESLEAERRKADIALARRRARDEAKADNVVAAARRQADEVVQAARAKVDTDEDTSNAKLPPDTLIEERTDEDAALRKERETADQSLSQERSSRRRALAALLAMEREQTDHFLLLERDSADVAIGSRDEFLAVVSHDLRNLLGAVAMSAESLINIDCAPDIQGQVNEGAQRIQRYTARMNRLVGDLLDVVSIESGHLALAPSYVDAAILLQESQEIYAPIAAARSITLSVEAKSGALTAFCDHGRVLQVLSNLLSNGIRFTPSGGNIHVVAEPMEQGIRLSVSDTGSGIASDQLERVFERFWQAAGPSGSGVGLGLYISRCIIDAHGGKLWVDSRVGEGSTFFFTLPVATEAQWSARKGRTQPPPA